MTPEFLKAETAAKLFELSTNEFLELVRKRILPGPLNIERHTRWDAESLKRIVRGEAAKPERDFDA